MPAPTDAQMIGQKYGRLTVLQFARDRRGRQTCVCRCDCGAQKAIQIGALRDGRTKSCGCLRHGMARTREHTAWAGMRGRCQNPRNERYADYGGRGIRVCERWQSFENFFADMGPKPAGLTLDRINNDGDYEPGNCHWATRREQNNNKRNVRLLTLNGETGTMAYWAQKLNVERKTLYSRMFQRGWPVERALSTPIDKSKRPKWLP